jgi:hypothetical protein
MDHIRIGKDIYPIERNGVLWVAARSGGVSTFSRPGIGKNWWGLPQGFMYPTTLLVVNDHGNHYSWEPSVEMPLSNYVALLVAVNPHFIKVS